MNYTLKFRESLFLVRFRTPLYFEEIGRTQKLLLKDICYIRLTAKVPEISSKNDLDKKKKKKTRPKQVKMENVFPTFLTFYSLMCAPFLGRLFPLASLLCLTQKVNKLSKLKTLSEWRKL